MSDRSADDRVGTMLGPYRLVSVLGQGGMGAVFRGEDTFTGRTVAVKLLHARFAQDAGFAQRFIREARAAVSLRHPNVVEVLHMNQDPDGVVYMVLELLEGCSLAAHLRKLGKLGLRETLQHLLPIMSALEVAHAKGIVHRDVKPENIFLSETASGVVPKLLDFGIAKMADAATGVSTQAGAIMGSPAYMSPEQAMGSNKIGPATDVWAMGVVIYECLAGRSPFVAADAQKVLARVLTAAPVPLGELARDLPHDVVQLVESALQKEAPERPTMRALKSGLTSQVSSAPAAGEAVATQLSGVDYSALEHPPDEGFPVAPPELERAPTDLSLSGDAKASSGSNELALASTDYSRAAPPRVQQTHGTLTPASSDPGPSASSLGRKRAVGAVLAIAAIVALVLSLQNRRQGPAASPAPVEPVESQTEVATIPAHRPEPAAVVRVETQPSTTSSAAPKVRLDESDTEVPTVEPHAPKHARSVEPARDGEQPPQSKVGGRGQRPATPPTPEELLRKRRDERIRKIPSISEL